MHIASLPEYRAHIDERMQETSGNVAVAEAGLFSVLGCIDSEVQKKHPTELIVAGALAYWALDQRGGANYFLQNLADLGNTTARFELHFPCGELLLEHGIDTWSGQERFTQQLVREVVKFNGNHRTNFDAVVHKNLGTAGSYLR